jgi:asparagine synthase (glutamine-hydrolysing)
MSGICGIFHFTEKKADSLILKKMADIMVHRGPDDEGYYLGAGHRMGLGVKCLLTSTTQKELQPAFSENKSVVVLKTGLISNHKQLKQQLESLGHKFRADSDTETIVHAYEQYGLDFTQQLAGAYAIALWDEKNNNLLLVRDQNGCKSIYYTIFNNTLLFSSEIKSLLQYPGFIPEIDQEAIHNYLTYQYVPGPGTIWKQVSRVPAASIITFNISGKTKTEKFWDLDYTKKTTMTFEEACKHIRQTVEQSTRQCMESTVPICSFLSGGFDSTIVTGLMSQMSPTPIKTFSIGFNEKDFSESKYSDIAAATYKTDHHKFILEPQQIELMEKVAWFYDQPFADPSALPTYYVCKSAKHHSGVALNGDCGDENFGGYLRYKALKGAKYFGFPFRLLGKRGTKLLLNLLPNIETSKQSVFKHVARLCSALYEPPEKRNVVWHSFFNEEQKQRIYSPDMKSQMQSIDSSDYLANIFVNAHAKDVVDRAIYTDLQTYLPECLVIKMEVASMANSLEARAPFCDHKLFEFTASLPSSWKIKGLSTSKYIMQQAFKDLLPEPIYNRSKQGFGIPVGKWFKVDMRNYLKDVVLSSRAINRGYFNKKQLEMFISEHVCGEQDHGYRLWALMMLELWHNSFVD